MAEFASAWRPYGSGGNMRAELALSDPPAVTKDTATVGISALLRIRTTGTLSDSVNSNVLSGSMSASDPNKSVVHGSGGGVTETCLSIVSFATVYGSPVTVTVTGTLSGYEIVSGSTAVTGSVTIPARPYQVPAAPDGVTVTRNSDTSHTVSWTRHPSTAGPYQAQQVHRTVDGGGWTSIASPSATATSYTDTTTSADHSYTYRVTAGNTTGTAYSAASATVYTTPKAPGTPTAVKSGANIVVSFANTARHDQGVKVYHSAAGGAFALLATVATPNLTSYTHTAPSTTETHAYKVATYIGSLISAQSAASNAVQLAAPPNAPTGLGPTTIRDAVESITLHWTHNPVDSSAQSGFQLRHREVGSATWTTVTVTSSVSQWVLPGGTYANPDTMEWQVATKGQDPSYGPFSATATLPSSTRPTALITTPVEGGALDTSTVRMTWGYYDAEGTPQTSWIAKLLDSDGAVVETKTAAGAVAEVTFATVVGDATSWSVSIAASDGAGLWSATDTVAFTVSYALPPMPVLDLAWDPDTATVTVEITNPAPAGFGLPFGTGEFGDGGFGGVGFGGSGGAATSYNDVLRKVDDGDWELIATGVPPNTAVTDYAPTVRGTTSYRARAVSGLPSTVTTGDYELTTPAVGDPDGSLWLSAGPGFSQVCRARYNVVVGDSAGRSRVLRWFAGRTDPVEFTGESRERVLTLTADILPLSGSASTPAEWFALADLPGPHLWRDPDGRYVLVSLSTPQITRSIGGAAHTLSLTATRVSA